jgi:hypothetical protein
MNIAKAAFTAAVVSFTALAVAAQAGADQATPPLPGDPPAAGQPVVDAPGSDALAAPVAPPVGPPPVPEMQNPVYGRGNSSGPLGFLRDAWHQAQDPYGLNETPLGETPGGAPPPASAGTAPQLPPGYHSLNAPYSDGPPVSTNYSGGPALPPGYYPLNGPPPPGYFDGPPADPAAPPTP